MSQKIHCFFYVKVTHIHVVCYLLINYKGILKNIHYVCCFDRYDVAVI